ncbi:hypothetical protein ES703_20893 [subsurface metagenome]
MAVNKIYKSKFLAYSIILSFLFLIATEATPNTVSSYSDEEFKPVVRVQEGKDTIPDAQKDRFDKLFEEGKKLYQEEMDYEGAIEKFNEALDLAVTRAQKADVFYHMSLAHYGDLSNKGTKELYETIGKLIEVDYYRELDELLCPPKYIELFEGIKKEYGALKVQSKPAGADVYLNDSKVPVGKTPLTVGSRAGSIKIKVKKGKKVKDDILYVIAGEETVSSTYVLKGVSPLLYVLGGIVAAAGAVLLLKSGAGEEGEAPGATTGSIQVNSTPQGASIYLDGAATGQTTNSTLSEVSPGSHTVTLVKEGYEDYEENISVTAGQPTTVNANLTAIIITVTNPTSSTTWIKGDDVEIRWGSSGSSSLQGNVRKSAGLNPLSNSGRNLSPSFRRRTLRSIHSFRNLTRTRRELDNRSNMGSSSIKEISSSKAIEINLNRSSRSQDASKKLSSSGKEVNIYHQKAKNFGVIKKNNSFGKVNSPISKGISPQIFKSSKNTRVLSLTNVKIELYKGGIFQETIETSTENDGTYTWTVNTSLADGSDYRVRISSVSEPGIYDESDAFTIETKSITVTGPTSTTIWTKGASANITWTSTGTISDVQIDLYKAGAFQETIESTTANDGTHTWTQVNPILADGSDYKVRISSVSEPGIYDESDAFTIEAKSITVTGPTSTTIWTKGASANITWTSTGTISDVKIELYKGGIFQETIEPSTENDGTYTWTVNTSLADGSDYKVRISSVSEPGIYYESDNFTIEAKSITVTEPTSSTIWTKGASANITWTSSGTISDVQIDLYKAGTFQETIESSTANDGTHTWTQVNPILADGSDYKVRISWVSDTGVFDESEEFAIEENSITVTEPTSITVWTKGASANITWTSTGTISDVKIELYKGGTFKETIVSSTTNDGTYTWTQVNPALGSAKNYHVKIICINVPEIYGESDKFEITN